MLRSLQRNRALVVPAGLLLLFGGGALLWRLAGLDATLLLGAALCGAGVVAVLALRYPLATVALTVLLGQLLDRDLTELAAVSYPTVGALRLRFFDPVLLGIGIALVVRLLAKDRRLDRFLIATGALWTVVFGWIALQTLRSVVPYGPVAAIGEFRTYYQYLLLIPYVVVSFRTEAAQWRLFRLLIVAGFLFAPAALLRGGLDFGFQIGPRWFNASSNFALLTAITALFIAARLRSIVLRDRSVALLSVLFVFVTLVNTHRSVWLATGVAVALLVLLGVIPFRRYVQLGIAGAIAAVAMALLFPALGSADRELGAFFQERLMAFTDPANDPTASWRSFLWGQILESIRAHPLAGIGLGNNFQLTGPDGRIWTTSPHNYYLMIGYHAGVTAVILYLLFVLDAVRRLLVGYGRSLGARQRTMLLSAIVVLAAGHALLIAYPHEFFLMLYLGLGLSVAMNVVPARRNARRSERARPDAAGTQPPSPSAEP